MIREVIATGRDAENAIENGCQELGVSRDDVEFEIISLPRKSMFGLKTLPAKVRVYMEIPDVVRTPREAPKPAPQVQSAPPREGQARQGQPPQGQTPHGQTRQGQPSREGNRPDPAQQGQTQKTSPRGKQPEPRDGGGREEHKAPRESQPAAPKVEIIPDENLQARVARAVAYTREVLGALGVTELVITPKYYSESVSLQLEGNGLGVIIGRRGETLDALQYLAGLVANRGEAEYIRLNIDSGNYREKRERTLEGLARKLATQAVRTGKATTLEPMNPYERRIIHGAVSQIRGATSSSVGVDPNRRVVISASGPPKRLPGSSPAEGDRRPSKNRGGRDRGRGGPERRPNNSGRPAGDGRLANPGRASGSGGSDYRRQEHSGPTPTTAFVGGEVQDLSLLTESLHSNLKAPPPPPPRPKQEQPPAPQRGETVPQAAEMRPEPPAAPKPEPTLTKAEEKAQVEAAPRYGKIEL